ncbi:hypothetical protein [Chryseobacterium herbae]|uniref:Transmembrane protein n=1 Tax=Chryseobacterium herbae TaxID=2976476 RepID=A0ABT2ITG2_9FLAO|nr:hypothetical protein [Chryseobacterium sp. pc1-10]MCT2562123.1 hypothetical protein [Chryseobacterium sp. pc1-10]
MDSQIKNRNLKYLGITCFIFSLLLPVPIPLYDEGSISFDDAGIWYLLLGWSEAFSWEGISWWANVFLLLSWFKRRNLKLSLIFISIAVFLALIFMVNAHAFQANMGIVGGGGGSVEIIRMFPGIGYAFWLGSLILFLLKSREKFLRNRDIDQSTDQ